MESGGPPIAKALEEIDLCVRFKQQHKGELGKWLKARKPAAKATASRVAGLTFGAGRGGRAHCHPELAGCTLLDVPSAEGGYPPGAGRNRGLTMRAWLLGLGALGLVVAAPAFASTNATIDWDKRMITATGQGAPDLNAPNPAAGRIGAERAAQLDAFRNILETLKGVRVSEGPDRRRPDGRDAVLKASVEGVLRNFKVTAEALLLRRRRVR